MPRDRDKALLPWPDIAPAGGSDGAGRRLVLPAMLDTPQVARGRLRSGRLRADAAVSVTPAGLLAIGGLVAAILWSVPPIIRAARALPR